MRRSWQVLAVCADSSCGEDVRCVQYFHQLIRIEEVVNGKMATTADHCLAQVQHYLSTQPSRNFASASLPRIDFELIHVARYGIAACPHFISPLDGFLGHILLDA